MEYKDRSSRFWNQDYIKMCLTQLLVMLAVMMQFPILQSSHQSVGADVWTYLLCTAAFCVGMVFPGPFSAYMVDAYKRKRVCSWSVVGIGIAAMGLSLTSNLLLMLPIRLFEGVCFGIFQMSLGSTIINDLSISERRTQTDYYFLWFGRLSLPLAMMSCWLFSAGYVNEELFYLLVLVCLAGLLVISTGRVPFRAPNKVKLVSFDRFWYPHAWLLCLNLLPLTMIEGIWLGGEVSPMDALLLFVGMLTACFTHRNFFEAADERADAVSGMLLVIASMILLLMEGDQRNVVFAAYFMLGVGIGWSASRFLLYFLKLSNHCQRGTLQQTYVITATAGIGAGFVLGYWQVDIYLTLLLSVITLLQYLLITHRWWKKQGGRDFKFREV